MLAGAAGTNAAAMIYAFCCPTGHQRVKMPQCRAPRRFIPQTHFLPFSSASRAPVLGIVALGLGFTQYKPLSQYLGLSAKLRAPRRARIEGAGSVPTRSERLTN
jgi:hypothetical protein